MERKLSYFNNNQTNFSLQACTVRSLLEGMIKAEALKDIYEFSELKRTLNFVEVLAMTKTLAQGLLRMGLEKNDVLALATPNTPESICLFFAAAFIGVVVVLVNPCYRLSEFEHILRATRAKCLCITDQLSGIDYLRLVRDMGLDSAKSCKGELVFPALPNLGHVILARNGHSKESLYWDLAEELLNGNDQPLELPEVNTDDPLLIYLSVSNWFG